MVQILAGRWVFALQSRRPALYELSSANLEICVGTYGPATKELRTYVKGDFLRLVYTAFLHNCFLGASISPFVVCTDASGKRGSVEYASQLTTTGSDFLQASTTLENSRASAACPVLIISLFNGIGGAFRCYDILP